MLKKQKDLQMELPKAEVDWLSHNEIGVLLAPHFAWVSQSNRQASWLNSCRDRLTSSAYAGLHGRRFHSYRTPYMPPICYDEMRLLITGVYENNQKIFLEDGGVAKLLDLLHSAERQIGMEQQTLIYEVTNLMYHHRSNGGVYILQSDPLWMRATPMISMYCLLIRISPAHTLGDDVMTTLERCKKSVSGNFGIPCSDFNYVRSSCDGMETIFKYGEKIWYPTAQENHPGDVQYYQIENVGIHGFSGQNRSISPAEYWYRSLEEKTEEAEEVKVAIAHEETGEAAV